MSAPQSGRDRHGKEWTIRIVNPVPYGPRNIGHVGLPGLWVEQLRRLGYLRTIKEYDGQHAERENALGVSEKADGIEILEFPAPKGVDSKLWADTNAERMRSFGINAASAPRWGADRGVI